MCDNPNKNKKEIFHDILREYLMSIDKTNDERKNVCENIHTFLHTRSRRPLCELHIKTFKVITDFLNSEDPWILSDVLNLDERVTLQKLIFLLTKNMSRMSHQEFKFLVNLVQLFLDSGLDLRTLSGPTIFQKFDYSWDRVYNHSDKTSPASTGRTKLVFILVNIMLSGAFSANVRDDCEKRSIIMLSMRIIDFFPGMPEYFLHCLCQNIEIVLDLDDNLQLGYYFQLMRTPSIPASLFALNLLAEKIKPHKLKDFYGTLVENAPNYSPDNVEKNFRLASLIGMPNSSRKSARSPLYVALGMSPQKGDKIKYLFGKKKGIPNYLGSFPKHLWNYIFKILYPMIWNPLRRGSEFCGLSDKNIDDIMLSGHHL